MYRAVRPQPQQRSVTWDRGGGGTLFGVRSIGPEQEGQLSDVPVRSLAIRFSACAGLYVAGRGFRIFLLDNCRSPENDGAGTPCQLTF